MKKLLILIILILTAAGIFLLSRIPVKDFLRAGDSREASAGKDPAASVRERVLDKEEFERKKSNREGVFKADRVRWNGAEAAVDEASGTVYLPCKIDADQEWEDILSGLLPADSKDIFWFCRDSMMEDIPGAIHDGHSFAALIETDGCTTGFSVVLTGLPALCIRKLDGEKIYRKENHDGRLSLIVPRGSEDLKGARDLNCVFHVRGNVSSTLLKKPYKITLLDRDGNKLKAGLLDLRSDDDWILNPLYTDSTRVREMTAYTLWDETEKLSETPLPSSRIRYTELFMDDMYCGIYGLMEPIDKKQLSLRTGDILYKIDRWNREYPYIDLYDEKEKAGEIEIYNDKGFPCVEIRYPTSWDNTATWNPMKVFHEFCFKENDPEKLTEAGVAADPGNLADFSLYCAMTHAMDSTWKNSFVIAKNNSVGYDLYRTIWDLNFVFGDVFVYEPETGYTRFDPDTAEKYTRFEDSSYDFEAFLDAEPEMWEILCEKWKTWRDNGISAEKVCSIAEENRRILCDSGAAAREEKLWPQRKSMEEAMEQMENWIHRRFDFLDSCFDYVHK